MSEILQGEAFAIRRLSIIDAPPNTRGNRVLAGFDLHVAGLLVKACVLVEKADGTISASPPMGKNHSGVTISVEWVDPDLAAAVTKRAAEVYTLLTGRKIGAVVPRGVVSDFGP